MTATPAKDIEAGWILESPNGGNKATRLVFGETRLRRAVPGLTIGRHPALCDLILDEESVSKRHVRISQTAEGLFVEDLNSLNGALLDNVELKPFRLTPISEGQTLTVGRVNLPFNRLSDRL